MKKQKKPIIIALTLLTAAVAATLFFVWNGDKNKADFQAQIRNSYPISKIVQIGNWAEFAFVKKDQNKIGWISDIHADRFKRRDIPSGLMFPRKYGDYLPEIFAQLQQQGISTVVVTGDNTNSGDDNYARQVQRISREKNMKVIWVKGNHDNDEVMSILGVGGNNYYYTDNGDTRIVVLNNVENDGGYYGSIDQNQLDWLKETLKTSKQVIVSMHIPIFSQENVESIHDWKNDDFTGVGDVLERYVELENILHTSGNVKMVISGHWHLPWRKTYNGIEYYGQAALTREGYSGAYAIIDLKNNNIDYKFAKLK